MSRIQAWRGAAIAGVLLLAGWCFGLKLALLLPPVQSLARERVEREVAARFGEAKLEGTVRGGFGLGLKVGPLSMGPDGLISVEEVTVSVLRGNVHVRNVRVKWDRRLLKLRRPPPASSSSSETNRAATQIVFEGLIFEQHRTRALAQDLGPFHGVVSRDQLKLELPDGGKITLGREGKRASLELRKISLRSARWVGPRFASLEATGLLNGKGELSERDGSISLSLSDVNLRDPRLAKGPLKGMELALQGRFLRQDKTLKLEEGQLWMGGEDEIKVVATAQVELAGDFNAQANVRLLPVTDEQLVSALPSELRPPPAAPHFQGQVAATAQFKGLLKEPDSWEFEAKLLLDDARKKSAAQPTLANELTYTAVSSTGRSYQVVIGPSNPTFVPLAELPPHASAAVLTSEDAGFFGHAGFDFGELRHSVVDALMDRRVRGASTLSQQLSKNLFLSPEHTLARKVREALTTLALEASVPKQRLLEVYLNAVEWGPGIYGIGAASQHYFAKDARELSPKESALLATLLPSPLRYHSYHLRGLSPVWEQRLDDLLSKMGEEGVLTEEELTAASAAPLLFNASCGT
ncbi:MAG: transglycosylase domain-containing protein [Myxococcaceae bacterium]